MSKIFACTAALLFSLLSGCASTGTQQVSNEDQTVQHKAKLVEATKSKIVEVVDAPYLGAVVRPIPQITDDDAALLKEQITIRMKGSLYDVCSKISSLVPVYASAEVERIEMHQPGMPINKGGHDLKENLDLLLFSPAARDVQSPAYEEKEIDYSGSLRGLLDLVANNFGMGWSFVPELRKVIFSKHQVRTFTLYAAPGKLTYSNQITNKSRETTSGTIGSGGINQPVSSGDIATQSSQTNISELTVDVWNEAIAGVSALLSQTGTVTGSQSAGTITVKDSSVVMAQVSKYISEFNRKIARQVALSIKVWSLEINDNLDVGINLQTLFESGKFKVITGNSLQFFDIGGDIATAIVDGKLKGSSAILKALKSFGRASQVTSGGGVVMSNTPVPVQATVKEAYLAAISKSQGDYGMTTEMTPGEVTTGFAMTVIPHVLERRRVVLQYNINLSALDGMTEIAADDNKVQLPKVSSRTFAQRVTMKLGQTLVLAGFEQEIESAGTKSGFLAYGKKSQSSRSLIVITIEVESGDI